jgi:hypothetical protein
MMVRAADLLAEARRIPGVAGRSTQVPDWAPVAHRIRSEATDDWGGDPTARLRHMIYAYPTFYPGIEDALRALKLVR